jgi:hypothetical protein
MTVRDYIFSLITTDSELNELGINANSTFTSNTLDTPQIRPMCILRWQTTNPGLIATREGAGVAKFPINQRILTVWIHEDIAKGDYTRIDASLKRLRDLLTGVEGVNVGEVGAWLQGINWEGDSDDLEDVEQRTLTRNAQFRLTGSAL